MRRDLTASLLLLARSAQPSVPARPLTVPRDLKTLPGTVVRWTIEGTDRAVLIGDQIVENRLEDGFVRAVSLARGLELWRRTLPMPSGDRAAPVALGGHTAVLHDAQRLIALDAASGATRWERPARDATLTPIEDDLLVVTPSNANTGASGEDTPPDLVRLRGKDGAELWRTRCATRCQVFHADRREVWLANGWRSTTRLAAASGAVIQASDARPPEFSRVREAVVVGGMLVRADGAKLVGRRGLSARNAWSRDIAARTPVVAVDGDVLTLAAGGVEAVDPETGSLRWRLALTPELVAALSLTRGWTALRGGRLLIPTETLQRGVGVLLIVDRRNGRVLDVRYGFDWAQRVFAAGDLVVLLTQNGRWTAIAIDERAPPPRATETVGDEVDRHLDALIRYRAVAYDPKTDKVEDIQALRSVETTALGALLRLGPAVYEPRLLEQLGVVDLFALRNLAPLLWASGSPAATAAIVRGLERTYGVAPSIDAVTAREALIRALGTRAPDQAVRAARETVKWLEVMGPYVLDVLAQDGSLRLGQWTDDVESLGERGRLQLLGSALMDLAAKCRDLLYTAANEPGAQRAYRELVRRLGRAGTPCDAAESDDNAAAQDVVLWREVGFAWGSTSRHVYLEGDVRSCVDVPTLGEPVTPVAGAGSRVLTIGKLERASDSVAPAVKPDEDPVRAWGRTFGALFPPAFRQGEREWKRAPLYRIKVEADDGVGADGYTYLLKKVGGEWRIIAVTHDFRGCRF